ncbi:cytochrome c oxidase assembly protein [Nocardia sp. NBC_01503]|uniref:cytochrome c oxidase assembly protein n=1 Tax=Nocardia sp. NBC_01503 TaxID=2975997 RepID=UPI002E7C1EF3|nr:cytochrome c oxidase assembly protein [Nocardia sp. NBC_01503]WTL30986.1 cytochrome c oxidase assembly protein [Nocardia sp. NBC_01503]
MSSSAPTLGDLLRAWTLSPIVDMLLVAGAVIYPWLVLRARSQGMPWPKARAGCWYAGLAVSAVTTNSALAIYSHNLFTAHMLVHLLMIMVVPALFVWAQPIRLVHSASGPHTRARIDRLRTRGPLRSLVSVRFTVPLYTAVILLTHLTGFQQAMATHMWIHDAELMLYFLSGYLLLLPLIGGELTIEPARPHPLRLVVLALCTGPDTLVGVTLMMSTSVLAPAYAASRTWGPTALADQSAAGVIMWVGGDGVMMVLMLIVVAQWIRSGDHGLGPWLDAIRGDATLGQSGADISDIDNEQAALDAYNARLAELHGRPHTLIAHPQNGMTNDE